MEVERDQEDMENFDEDAENWSDEYQSLVDFQRDFPEPINEEFPDISSFLIAHALPKSSPVSPSHTSMLAGGHYGPGDSGKYFIFWEEYDQFYKLYAESVTKIITGRDLHLEITHHLSEEASALIAFNPDRTEWSMDRTNKYFKFFVDLDPTDRVLDDMLVAQIIGRYKLAIMYLIDIDAIPEEDIPYYDRWVSHNECDKCKDIRFACTGDECDDEDEDLTEELVEEVEQCEDEPTCPMEQVVLKGWEHPALQHYVLRNSANPNKLHIYFPSIIVNKPTALLIRDLVVQAPEFQHIPIGEREHLFDPNFGGLRLLGSFKLDKKQSPWSIVAGTYLPPGRPMNQPLTIEDLYFYSIKPSPDSLPAPLRPQTPPTYEEEGEPAMSLGTKTTHAGVMAMLMTLLLFLPTLLFRLVSPGRL